VVVRLKKAPLEKDNQKVILAWLRVRGCLAIRVNSGKHFYESGNRRYLFQATDTVGVSDIVGMLPRRLGGLFFAFEVKRDGKLDKTTPLRRAAQESFLKRVRDEGGVAAFVTSIEDVQAVLAERGLSL